VCVGSNRNPCLLGKHIREGVKEDRLLLWEFCTCKQNSQTEEIYFFSQSSSSVQFTFSCSVLDLQCERKLSVTMFLTLTLVHQK